MQIKLIKFIFSLVFIFGSSVLHGRLMSPEAYGMQLQKMSNEELQKTFDQMRVNLVLPAQKVQKVRKSSTDFSEAQNPVYKMSRINVVIKEIARRCGQAKSSKELASLTDMFFR